MLSCIKCHNKLDLNDIAGRGFTLYHIQYVSSSISKVFSLRLINNSSASLHSYHMMRRCWEDNPEARPTFTDLCRELEDWIQREIPYLDMEQLNEDQPYYEASAVSLSSGSSCDGHAPGENLDLNTAAYNLAFNENEVTSESTNL